jgi:hypothetical protein
MHRTVGACHVVRPRAVLVPSAGPRPPHSDPIAPAPYGMGMEGSSTLSGFKQNATTVTPTQRGEGPEAGRRRELLTVRPRLACCLPPWSFLLPFFPREARDPVVFCGVSRPPSSPSSPFSGGGGCLGGYPHCPRRPRVVVKATLPVVGLKRGVCRIRGNWDVRPYQRLGDPFAFPPGNGRYLSAHSYGCCRPQEAVRPPVSKPARRRENPGYGQDFPPSRLECRRPLHDDGLPVQCIADFGRHQRQFSAGSSRYALGRTIRHTPGEGLDEKREQRGDVFAVLTAFLHGDVQADF